MAWVLDEEVNEKQKKIAQRDWKRDATDGIPTRRSSESFISLRTTSKARNPTYLSREV